AVALWAFGHLYKNGALVTDNAMVHVMLLSRTRRDGDFALACWDCSKNKIEELQLQILPGPGEPKFHAPGGFLLVNWEKSSSAKPASGGESSNALMHSSHRHDRARGARGLRRLHGVRPLRGRGGRWWRRWWWACRVRDRGEQRANRVHQRPQRHREPG